MSNDFAKLVEEEKARDEARADAAAQKQRVESDAKATRERAIQKWQSDKTDAFATAIAQANAELDRVSIRLSVEHSGGRDAMIGSGRVSVEKNGASVGVLPFIVHADGRMTMFYQYHYGAVQGAPDDPTNISILEITEGPYRKLLADVMAKLLPKLK
jgi:hypothetical protein